MNTIGIFGTSGFAREVGDIAWALGLEPVYLAANAEELAHWTFDERVILESDLATLGDVPFAIGIGDNHVRARLAACHAGTLKFPQLVHPSASFGKGQRERMQCVPGIVICAGVRFTNNIDVGRFSIFNLNATVGHDSVIEEFVNVSPGANISGNVHIEARAWIGTGAAINQGTGDGKLRIGHHTMVGSGSVVVKPCDAEAVYAGVPAKRIK